MSKVSTRIVDADSSAYVQVETGEKRFYYLLAIVDEPQERE